jgi:hypothetical protein
MLHVGESACKCIGEPGVACPLPYRTPSWRLAGSPPNVVNNDGYYRPRPFLIVTARSTQLRDASAQSTKALAELGGKAQWQHSYVVDDSR